MRNLFIAVFLILSVNLIISQQNTSQEKYIVAYVFVMDQVLNPDEIAVEKLTHINYAFADIKDGEILQGFSNDSLNFSLLNQTKTRNPNLKILISVGGWTWSKNFSDMVLTRESRQKFIESAIKFVELHNLDGIDFDWEYPGMLGDNNVFRPEDKQNFTLFMKQQREALDLLGKKNNKHYLISIAAGGFQEFLDNTEMDQVQKYLDYVNIMTYDLVVVEADSIQGHHANLYTNPYDSRDYSVNSAVRRFIAAGVPPEKIVIGVPFYARTAQGSTTLRHGLYQKAEPVKKRLWASFKNIKENLENKNGFVRYWDVAAQAPYLYNEEEKIFITYDDEESLSKKCEYIKFNQLKGVMFWTYHSDYESRLLNAVYNGLR